MVKLFRNFSPVNIFWLAVITLLVRLGYLMNPPAGTAFLRPFTGLVPAYVYSGITPIIDVLLSAACVFAQALIINGLINRYNLLGRSSFLPALMYVVATSLFSPFVAFTAPLVCNFLIIWMLFKLFSFYKSPDVKSATYDLGMIVALGTLVYLPFTFFFLAIWAGLVLFRAFSWRDWVASILGYVTIYFFFAVFYYLTNQLGRFYGIWLPLAVKFQVTGQINYYNYLVLLPVAFILVLCFFKLRENFFKSFIQSRKSFQLLFFMFVVGALSFYVRKDFRLSHFVLCAVPASIFFAYYFLHAKIRWFYESLFLLLVLGIMAFQFNLIPA